MNKAKVMQRLQEQYDYIKNFYNEDNLLGIFLYGSQNYGFATDESDVDSKVILIPSFEELCLEKSWLSKEHHYPETDEHIEVKDIRTFVDNWKKQNINFIEVLYTEYCIINPKYEALFKKYFIDNREEIAHYDEKKAVMSMSHQAMHTLRQDMEDKKKLHNAARLWNFLTSYIGGVEYQTCLCPTGKLHGYLWSLKYDDDFFTEGGRRREAEVVLQKLQDLVDEWDLKDSEYNAELDSLMKQGILDLIQCGLEKSQTYMSKDEFISLLTHAEKSALSSIMETIENEGNVTISKLVRDYVISRPVYNNLLLKLQKYDIANVVNMGAKGTFISFTNPFFRR